jgi:hypothetical protein
MMAILHRQQIDVNATETRYRLSGSADRHGRRVPAPLLAWPTTSGAKSPDCDTHIKKEKAWDK